MTDKQDYLPEAERHKPFCKEDALLVFGSLGEPENPLYQPTTDSVPGSWERVEVYAERARRREPLFNPNDRKDYHGAGLEPRRRIDPISEILKRMEK